MKGVVSIIELLITGVILILAFIHFFPQYSIRTNWSSTLLDLSVKDTLNTIDRLNKTHDFAVASIEGNEFEAFMEKLYSPEYTNQAFVWWKEVNGLGASSSVPYFTEAKKETMVDVIVIDEIFYVYSFTLGLGYPY